MSWQHGEFTDNSSKIYISVLLILPNDFLPLKPILHWLPWELFNRFKGLKPLPARVAQTVWPISMK